MILSEESEVIVLGPSLVGGCPLVEADRYATAEDVIYVVGARFNTEPQVGFLELQPCLERVAAGDVRHGETLANARH